MCVRVGVCMCLCACMHACVCVCIIHSIPLIHEGVSSKDDEDDDSAPLMILEYMPYGDLQNFLENHRYINYVHKPAWLYNDSPSGSLSSTLNIESTSVNLSQRIMHSVKP